MRLAHLREGNPRMNHVTRETGHTHKNTTRTTLQTKNHTNEPPTPNSTTLKDHTHNVLSLRSVCLKFMKTKQNNECISQADTCGINPRTTGNVFVPILCRVSVCYKKRNNKECRSQADVDVSGWICSAFNLYSILMGLAHLRE